MRSNNIRITHPATLYFGLMILVILLSWILEIQGKNIFISQSEEIIYVQSLISPEGIRWFIRNIVSNFTNFAPLGMVIVAMFGIGVAQHSGFINSTIYHRISKNKSVIIYSVIILGILSNMIGDAGYIILLPISASLFYHAGLHPVAGIITSYVSVACGYSANVIISTMDPLLARITEETAVINGISKNTIGPLSNYYFMVVSTILITITIYYIVKTKLIKQLVLQENNINHYKPLSRKERRALIVAWSTGIIYLLIILLSTFSSFGILRGVSGNLMRSPFIMGILFLISFGIGLMGMVYGLVSGKYKSDSDIIQGLAEPIRMLGVYFVIAFFAAQMFACLEYSNIDKYLIVRCANIFVNIEMSVLPMMIVFIFFSAIINLMMVSATSKWSFIGFIFIPIFYQMGVAPDIVQCAFRIGDSSTNAITPFLFYMPLILTYMLHYDKKASYLSLLKYTWRFSVYIFIVWTILFILWHLLKIPFGL